VATLDELGSKINEAIALQGKINGSSQKIAELSEQIDANQAEIARLKDLEVKTKTLISSRDGIVSVNKTDKADLKSRLATLKEAGIAMDLGTAQTTSIKF
jgi:uncharacterized small protein (DUF1192 family)